MAVVQKNASKRLLFDPIEAIVADLRRGRMVVVTDATNRENEGDLVMAAAKTTPKAINFMARHGRGLICVPATAERLAALGIARMTSDNREAHRTEFMVSVDAREDITTGISAQDRARTIRLMARLRPRARDLVQPGHVFPLRARPGGVLQRAGHTEAVVDLVRLAGLPPVGVLCEIMNPDGSMARQPQLRRFCRRHRLKLCRIEDLIAYRHMREHHVEKTEEADLPTPWGVFRLHVFRSRLDGRRHLALALGRIDPASPVLTRVHAECVASDVFQSAEFGSPSSVADSLKAIREEGSGLLLYMRHEGWSSTMLDSSGRVRAPHLREYGLGAQILAQLGVRRIRLLTNHPHRLVGLSGFGLEIVGRVPLKPGSSKTR
ncbi:MAG: 3,4-dihydroxy-2-butanone-4-phosphate synthase [Verrucomicrobiae bacterium]|nr:3,4-dihydroxy-2-butanone-4-phosphate synthase [Verrucomicrobiae bacterium]